MVRHEGSIHGAGSSHDDRVMALALACRAWDDAERKKLISQDRTRDNEAKRRDLSPVDMQRLFQERLVGNFFEAPQRNVGLLPIIFHRQNEAHRMPIGTWDWNFETDTLGKIEDIGRPRAFDAATERDADALLAEILGDEFGEE